MSKNKLYDPDPRRKRRKGHRKGVEPAGLKRWRLSHRRTHDPGYASTHWKGPHKKRYDPAPPRKYSRARHAVSRVGRGAEGILNKWGTAIGFALGMGAGVYGGWNTYNTTYGKGAGQDYLATIIGGDMVGTDGTTKLGTRTPEISKLWGSNDFLWSAPRGPLDYLQYKFTGTSQYDKNPPPSAWVIPFWVSIGTWIASTIGLKIGRLGKLHRILRPLSKIAKGSTIATAIGALALPGCDKKPFAAPVLPPPPNTLSMMQDSPGHFVQAQEPRTIEFTYKG